MIDEVKNRIEAIHQELKEVGIKFSEKQVHPIERLEDGYYWTMFPDGDCLEHFGGENCYYLGCFEFLVLNNAKIRSERRHVFAHSLGFLQELHVSGSDYLRNNFEYHEFNSTNGKMLEVMVQEHQLCQYLIENYQQPTQSKHIGETIQTLDAEGKYLEEGFFRREDEEIELTDMFGEPIFLGQGDHCYRIQSSSIEYIKKPNQPIWELKEVYHLEETDKIATDSPIWGAHSDVYLQTLEQIKGLDQLKIA